MKQVASFLLGRDDGQSSVKTRNGKTDHSERQSGLLRSFS